MSAQEVQTTVPSGAQTRLDHSHVHAMLDTGWQAIDYLATVSSLVATLYVHVTYTYPFLYIRRY